MDTLPDTSHVCCVPGRAEGLPGSLDSAFVLLLHGESVCFRHLARAMRQIPARGSQMKLDDLTLSANARRATRGRCAENEASDFMAMLSIAGSCLATSCWGAAGAQPAAGKAAGVQCWDELEDVTLRVAGPLEQGFASSSEGAARRSAAGQGRRQRPWHSRALHRPPLPSAAIRVSGLLAGAFIRTSLPRPESSCSS